MKQTTLSLLVTMLAVIFLSTKANAQPFTQPLHIMDTLSGTTFNLSLQQGSHQFYQGVNTGTYGYNGNILGPTLILNHGDSVIMNVTNNLTDTTTTHWHGLHIPAQSDGGPHNIITPGMTWSPTFKVLDKAATYWYHPHLHMKTEQQVARGAVGLIIVRDNEEATKALPRSYGVDDFPLVIQSKIINPNNGQIVLPGPWDTVMTINGVVKPYLEVPAQPVRFRMLNGSSRRVYMLGLSDNRQYYQIATDGSLTPQPRQMNRLRLANGERSEIVIDFTGLTDSVYYLMCYGTELGQFIPGGAGGGGGMGANPYDSADYAMMKIQVIAPTTNPVVFDPSDTLTTFTGWNEADADTTRLIRLTGGIGVPFSFDNATFDHHVINHTVRLGDIEIWELRNTTFLGHPFHIHDVQFMVLDKDGLPPPLAEQGLKDVIFVEAFTTTRFITQFLDFADSTMPYMYHCHNMAHEDGGMMGQFLVLDTGSLSLTVNTSSNPAIGGITTGNGSYSAGTSVTVSATANNGYTFIHWTEHGHIVSPDSNYTFTITSNRDLVANFTANVGNFTVTTSSNPTAGGITTGDGSYSPNSSVTVTATPNTGYNFSNWTESGNVVSPDSNYTFTITSNRDLVAEFALLTAVVDLLNVSVRIYPNPSKGRILISTDEATDLKVYNSIGQLVLSQPIDKGGTELTLLDKGLLLFVFGQVGQQTVRKQLIIE